MKRSQVNAYIEQAMAFLKEHQFHLPPFAFFSPEDWACKGHEYDEIRENALGWDITDFGSGDFQRIGLFLFTLRNGNLKNPACRKPYAEKIMVVNENQVTPYHFHWKKMEDIINRGGGNLMIKVYNAAADETLADTPVELTVDGRRFTVPAGTTLRLKPGESVTFPTRLYHTFWAEEGCGTALIGEVSQVNDDAVDNRFLEKTGRFPAIEEDEPARYLLGNEYPPAAEYGQ